MGFLSLQTLSTREKSGLVIPFVESLRKLDISKILNGNFSDSVCNTYYGENIPVEQRVPLDVGGGYIGEQFTRFVRYGRSFLFLI